MSTMPYWFLLIACAPQASQAALHGALSQCMQFIVLNDFLTSG
jgi:hypothetical protein